MAGKYRGVSAAEKYAELEERGESRPLCECHGLAMGWDKRTCVLAGGIWKCAEKNREKYRKYREENLEKERERRRRHREANAEDERESHRKWLSNPMNQLKRDMQQQEYRDRKALERMERQLEEMYR